MYMEESQVQSLVEPTDPKMVILQPSLFETEEVDKMKPSKVTIRHYQGSNLGFGKGYGQNPE